MSPRRAKVAEEAMRVLVVGHTAISAESFTRALTDAGLGVVAACHDRSEVSGAVSHLRADVVVLETGAERTNDLRATSLIKRARPASKVLPIGLQHSCDAVEFAAAGASGYLLRDDPLAKLVSTIRAVHHNLTLCTPQVADEILARIRFLSSAESPPPCDKLLQLLTAREAQVLELMVEGRLNKEIGHDLGIALSTVKNHVHSILTKLRTKDRRQASLLAADRAQH